MTLARIRQQAAAAEREHAQIGRELERLQEAAQTVEERLQVAEAAGLQADPIDLLTDRTRREQLQAEISRVDRALARARAARDARAQELSTAEWRAEQASARLARLLSPAPATNDIEVSMLGIGRLSELVRELMDTQRDLLGEPSAEVRALLAQPLSVWLGLAATIEGAPRSSELELVPS